MCDLTPFQYTAREMDIARREFIRLTAGLALASMGARASANGAAVSAPDGDGKILPDIVYQLFPHAQLSDEVYKQVTGQLEDRISQSAELTAMMNDARGILEENADEPWSTLPDREKVEALENIQHTPFFQFVLNETLSGVYRHPLTWELLRYEGSSLEFGGYINRGFNDIDWLPD